MQGVCGGFALIGGLAVSVRGVPRATCDIDFLVEVSDRDCSRAASLLDAEYFPPDFGDPLAGVFRFRSIKASTDIDVQAIRLGPKLSSAVLTDISDIPLGELSLPVVGVRGLIVLKLYAGGPQDLLDVAQLIEVSALADHGLKELEVLCSSFGLQESLAQVVRK